MDYSDKIDGVSDNPELLEQLYRGAEDARQTGSFRDAIMSAYRENPDNLLLAAWYHRLHATDAVLPLSRPESHQPRWWLAIPMGVLTGLIFWAISSPDLMVLDHLPYVALLWAPVAAVGVMGFLVLAGTSSVGRAGAIGLVLAAACVYVFLIAPIQSESVQQHYVNLMALHLPLLALVAVGVTLVGMRENRQDRFAFLLKSLEIFVTCGLFGIAGVIFVQITVGMFESLGIVITDSIARLVAALGAGMIPVLGVVTIYNPAVAPFGQDFSRGLIRLIATLTRILLPLTAGVLLVYICFIPFNFMGPFEDRELLIIFNVMLFAIMALLLGATPIDAEELSDRVRRYLRRGILAVASLAVIVSVYALAAVAYRTIDGGMTVNRLTVIGWNSINIATLILLVYRQARADGESWVSALHSIFSTAAYGYVAWGLFVVVAIPLLFL
jgi:hypothetical protein